MDEKDYANKLEEKRQRLGMTHQQYQLFLLQGIKKELIQIRITIEKRERE